MDKCSDRPWYMSRDAVPDGIVQVTISADNGDRVATVFQTEANARLIASAPTLLAALDKVQEALANWRDNPPSRTDVLVSDDGIPLTLEEVKYCIVDDAIRQATGGDE
jgi:hypothetical protein